MYFLIHILKKRFLKSQVNIPACTEACDAVVEKWFIFLYIIFWKLVKGFCEESENGMGEGGGVCNDDLLTHAHLISISPSQTHAQTPPQWRLLSLMFFPALG